MEADNTLKETANPELAVERPNEEMMASAFAPVTPLVAKVSSNFSFVHDLLMKSSFVSIFISPSFPNMEFCVSFDRFACAKAV